MANKCLMELMLLISAIYINLCLMLNFLYQSYLILQIKMHAGTKKEDVILAKEFKNLLEKEHRQNGAIDQEQ